MCLDSSSVKLYIAIKNIDEKSTSIVHSHNSNTIHKIYLIYNLQSIYKFICYFNTILRVYM